MHEKRTVTAAERLQELIGECHESLELCRSLNSGNGAGLGFFEMSIKEAELAQLSGDAVAIIAAIKNLEGFIS